MRHEILRRNKITCDTPIKHPFIFLRLWMNLDVGNRLDFRKTI